MDHFAVEDFAFAKLASAEAQLWGEKENILAQARKIDELEVELAKANAELGRQRSRLTKALLYIGLC